jgi:hypothetical protein
MKTEYGIPVPRGVQKTWTSMSMHPEIALDLLRPYTIPEDWGGPSECVAWYDRFRRWRLIVAHYPNGRSATVRIDANGNWKTTFGDVTELKREGERHD